MRWLLALLLFVATSTLVACTSDDPAELEGTPILRHRTDGSKAIRADDDDDDDTTPSTTSKKKKTTPATTGGTTTASASTSNADDGPTFDPTIVANSGTSSSSGAASSAPQTAATVEEQCFEIINKYRAKTGLPPLARWTNNESCSDTESQQDSQSGQAHGSFTQCGEMAQNECPGYPSSAEQNLPECLADMYAEGPGGGHYDNMTSTQYTMVSCGVFEVGDGTFWSVQNFR